jgi:hypothetical protein
MQICLANCPSTPMGHSHNLEDWDSTLNGARFKLVPHVRINSSMLHNIMLSTFKHCEFVMDG